MILYSSFQSLPLSQRTENKKWVWLEAFGVEMSFALFSLLNYVEEYFAASSCSWMILNFFFAEGTAVSIVKACEQAVVWSRRLQEVWHQCSLFLLTILQTPVVIDHKICLSDCIADKLESFYVIHVTFFSLVSFESSCAFSCTKCKH